jgi:hypothetical protein
MSNQPKVRFVVPAALAILLTFGRNGMMPFEGYYSPLDQAMNLFVVIVAPIFAFKDMYPHPYNHNLHLFIPIFFLTIWVAVCIVLGSPSEYWPNITTLITITLSILMASQITSFELSRVRHFILLFAGFFSVYTLLFGRDSLNLIFLGALHQRLGSDISSANLIIFPRVMYMLIVTGLISIIIEKKIWIKILAASSIILPLIIAFATGGRGPLIGAFVAMLTFILGLGINMKKFYTLIVIGLISFLGYNLINRFFPLMRQRIMEEGDSGRYDIWTNLIDPSNISLFGQGVGATYPHNIFLEMFFTYGIIGFCIFLLVLAITVKTSYRYYRTTRDLESLWAISLLVLQLTAQQFSLDIFYGSLWAAMVLPLGYGWKRLYTTTANLPLVKPDAQNYQDRGYSV